MAAKTMLMIKRLFHPTNKQSIKVMVSAFLTWYGATKPFFINDKGLKVDSKTYKKKLEKELIPDIKRIMKRRDWMFIQDSASSHRSNLVQDFLAEKLTNALSNTKNGPRLPWTVTLLIITFGMK